MKHLDDFNEFSSVNENKETSPVEVQVIGKSMDSSTSQKKAHSNATHLADMLGVKYDVIETKAKKEDDSIITLLNILIHLTSEKITSLENSIEKFEDAPFSIVKK